MGEPGVGRVSRSLAALLELIGLFGQPIGHVQDHLMGISKSTIPGPLAQQSS